MALLKPTLEAQLTTLFDSLSTDTGDAAASRARMISGLATAIDTYIKTATVTVSVATTGSAAAQAGGGTGTLS